MAFQLVPALSISASFITTWYFALSWVLTARTSKQARLFRPKDLPIFLPGLSLASFITPF